MHRIIAVVLTLAFAMTSVAQAASGKAAKNSTVSGTFVGYQEHKNQKKIVTITGDDGKIKEQAVRVDDSTKITRDGNTVAASALRPGDKLTITLTKKLATEITAVSH